MLSLRLDHSRTVFDHARMGHDSERAALIYQHETRGADQAITRAIDTHVQAEQANDDDDDGTAGVLAQWANGPLMARMTLASSDV
jgi:hypothetical protein